MKDKIKIIFFGDFVTLNPEKITLDESFKEFVNNSHYKICNFEAPINMGFSSISKSGPVICQSPDSVKLLNEIGINLVSLANNHMMDYGEKGGLYTISKLGNIQTVGFGKYFEAFRVKTITIENFKIGFLSFTQLEEGALDDEASIEDVGCAWINHSFVNDLIVQAKSKVDYLFVLPHAGVEDIDYPLPEWRKRYKELIDYGADGIIASHPHVPQGWEVYKEKPIFYSLGNFCFEKQNHVYDQYWNIGLAIEIYIPIDINNKLSFNVNVTMFEDNKLKIVNNLQLNNHIEKICKILQDDKKYKIAIDNEVLRLWRDVYSFYLHYYTSSLTLRYGFLNFFKMCFNKIFRRNNNHLLLNTYLCESHRYVITRALKLISNE